VRAKVREGSPGGRNETTEGGGGRICESNRLTEVINQLRLPDEINTQISASILYCLPITVRFKIQG